MVYLVTRPGSVCVLVWHVRLVRASHVLPIVRMLGIYSRLGLVRLLNVLVLVHRLRIDFLAW